MEDEALWPDLLNDLQAARAHAGQLNLFQYVFVRQNLVAWSLVAGNATEISVKQLSHFFAQCLSSFSSYDAAELQVLVSAVLLDRFDFFSDFLSVLNVTHAYLIFKSMMRYSSISGSITYA